MSHGQEVIKRMREWVADTGLFPFFREMLLNPMKVGAALPSSKRLARVLAEQIPLDPHGLVIELGPGTGIVTEALLKRGIPPAKIVAVERSEALVRYLRKKFPQIVIIHGDAMHLSELISQETLPVTAIVSSLPLRSLPKNIVEGISTELEKIMKHNSLFIQFTYFWKNKYPGLTLRLIKQSDQIVWWNFPPARVDVFNMND